MTEFSGVDTGRSLTGILRTPDIRPRTALSPKNRTERDTAGFNVSLWSESVSCRVIRWRRHLQSGFRFPTPAEGREDRKSGHFGSCVGDAVFFRFWKQTSGMVDRPDNDASSAEIARWMEEDFWESVTEGIEESDGDVSADE